MIKELSNMTNLVQTQTNKQTKQKIANDFSFGFLQGTVCGERILQLLIALLVIGTHIFSVAVYC